MRTVSHDRCGRPGRSRSARRHGPTRAGLAFRLHSKSRAAHDPVALALAEKYPAVRMPALGVAQNDASDLIAYLDAEASRLRAIQGSSSPTEQNIAHSHHDHHH